MSEFLYLQYDSVEGVWNACEPDSGEIVGKIKTEASELVVLPPSGEKDEPSTVTA